MMVFKALDAMLDSVFWPFFSSMPILIALILFSFVISVMITLVYKYTTDQNLMKQLKEEMKATQKKIKELMKTNPDEAMRIQKESMKTHKDYMMMSFKATAYTILPMMLIFPWMAANLAYEPIKPGEPFTVTLEFNKPISSSVMLDAPPGITIDDGSTKEVSGNNVFWTVKGEEGTHVLEYVYNDERYRQEIVITNGHDYSTPVTKVEEKGSDAKLMKINYSKRIIMDIGILKGGWLLTYFIFSIIFSLVLRKALKVH